MLKILREELGYIKEEMDNLRENANSRKELKGNAQNKKKMLLTEMKNAFDGLSNKWSKAKDRINEVKVM